MRRTSIAAGVGLGLLTSIPVVAVLSAGYRLFGLPYVPFSLFEWLTRVLPGDVVTFGIDRMVDVITGLGVGPTSAVAKAAEMGLAVALIVLGGGLLGGVLALLGRILPDRLGRIGAVSGFVLFAMTVAIVASLGFSEASPVASVLWLAGVLTGWGALLGGSIARIARPPNPSQAFEDSRRRFLAALITGAVAVFAFAVGIGRRRGRAVEPGIGGTGALPQTSGPAASPAASELAQRAEPLQGMRPELTATEDFYRIDINLFPPRADPTTWRLTLEGMVERPLSLSLDDVRARAARSQAITLQCISNRLGGDLISTAVFTGVVLKELLAEAGLRPGVGALRIDALDGFFESVTREDFEDERTLLVYEMNGAPLPAEHGFPLRIYIPNRFGMKQPKWITRIKAVPTDEAGYWVVRGWSHEAVVPTTSVVAAVGMSMMLGQAEVLPLGGYAFAGARGISRVEVQVDDGPWTEANLRTPALSPLTWVQWRYDWPYRPGEHTFRVRAWDGTGTLQPLAPRGPRPDGATGIHSLTTTV